MARENFDRSDCPACSSVAPHSVGWALTEAGTYFFGGAMGFGLGLLIGWICFGS